MRSKRVAIGLIVLIGALVAPAGHAEDAHRLSSAREVVQFGRAEFQLAGVVRPEMCTPATCEETGLEVALPPNAWQRPDDGLQVSIRWGSVGDEFDLYVYAPDGQLAAYADQLDSNAQSVVVPRAVNGHYRIVVAAKYFSDGDTAGIVGSAEPKSYRGVAHVHRGVITPGAKPRPLLPTISIVPPHNFHLDGVPPVPSTPIGYRAPQPVRMPTSCYADEMADGAARCLRFNNELANVGEGEMTLRFRWDGTTLLDNCEMQQVVHWSDGHDTYRDAGPCTFHVQHGHFHYENMGSYMIVPVLPNGRRAATPAKVSKKIGFCAIDVDYFGYGRPDSSPRGHSFPTCNVPSEFTDGVWQYMGIARGWGDIYTWDLPSQYIEIGGLDDGVYDVVSVGNPDGAILVKTRAGEVSATRIRLTGDTVEVLREGVDAFGRPTGDPRTQY